MKRRGFFTALGGAVAVTAAVAVAETPEPLEMPDVINYNGFIVRWTGWKEMAQSLDRAGQWIARPADGKPIICKEYPWGCEGVESSFPGGVGYFCTGQWFDTCFWDGQREVVDNANDWYERPGLMLKAQRDALAKLKKFINENC